MAAEERLGISESDVRAMGRQRRLEMLFKPVTASISIVGGFILSFSLTTDTENSSSSYPYAAALAAGLPSLTDRKAGRRRRPCSRLMPWLAAGLLLGAIVGHITAEASNAENSLGLVTYYGISARS